MVKLARLKKALRAILFTALLIAYSVMYLEPAIKQYHKKDKTIAQKRENIAHPESPVLVLCPDPPFKASFFEQFGLKKNPGAEQYFWVTYLHWPMVENHTSTAMDMYMNMSYQLGKDWNISLFGRYALLLYSLVTYFIFKCYLKVKYYRLLVGLKYITTGYNDAHMVF